MTVRVTDAALCPLEMAVWCVSVLPSGSLKLSFRLQALYSSHSFRAIDARAFEL